MGYTRYIARKRARFTGYGGRQVNIPWGTEMEAADGDILFEGLPLCAATSENAHLYFVQNDDGQGRERGELVEWITATLAKRDKHYQTRWDRLWADKKAGQYRDHTYDDFWVWEQAFYNAPVDDLRHIATLVNAGRLTKAQASKIKREAKNNG